MSKVRGVSFIFFCLLACFIAAILFTKEAVSEDLLLKGKYFKVDSQYRLQLDKEAIPKSYEIDDVPNRTQDTQWCGPTSLSIVLEYWLDRGARVSYNKKMIKPLLLGRTIDKEEDGITGKDIVDMAKSLGLFAAIFHAEDLDTIKPILASDFPIIMLNRTDNEQEGHARVITGYNDKRDKLNIHDPARGVYVRSYDRVLAKWEPYGKLFVLIGPKN